MYLAEDKACAFRKRAWVKILVFNTQIEVILHRWLRLLSTNTFRSLMKLLYHSEIEIRKYCCEFQSISVFKFSHVKPFDGRKRLKSKVSELATQYLHVKVINSFVSCSIYFLMCNYKFRSLVFCSFIFYPALAKNNYLYIKTKIKIH